MMWPRRGGLVGVTRLLAAALAAIRDLLVRIARSLE
jgi:hypothetical protein